MSEPEAIAAAVARAVRSEVAPLREAFEDQARRFELLRACFRDVTLSKAEAAEYVGVSTRTIDRKVKAEELHPVPGGRRRFTLDELDRAVRDGVFRTGRELGSLVQSISVDPQRSQRVSRDKADVVGPEVLGAVRPTL